MLARKSQYIEREMSRETFAYALLYREARRSLRRYPEGDVVRDRLAEVGFAVRDAEQMPGKDSAFFVISTAAEGILSWAVGGAPQVR